LGTQYYRSRNKKSWSDSVVKITVSYFWFYCHRRIIMKSIQRFILVSIVSVCLYDILKWIFLYVLESL